MTTTEIAVPANSSRFFMDYDTARLQPWGKVALDLDKSGLIVNTNYAPNLIQYDHNYFTPSLTPSGSQWLPTMDYLPKALSICASKPTICDIGCGQGELVSALLAEGFVAHGFDPVLRNPTDNLFAEYWDPSHAHGNADLLVMRPVLAQIQNPWDFVRRASGRKRLLLVEYPRIEWMIENGLWWNINHDYVNFFTDSDFDGAADVKARGVFGDGEWGWALLQLDPSTRVGSVDAAKTADGRVLLGRIEELIHLRQSDLDRAANISDKYIIWGAAGKGIVAASALTEFANAKCIAVDLDPQRQGLFLECSGVEVWSPERFLDSDGWSDAPILVVNPRHLKDVSDLVGRDNGSRLITRL